VIKRCNITADISRYIIVVERKRERERERERGRERERELIFCTPRGGSSFHNSRLNGYKSSEVRTQDGDPISIILRGA
jgi:hypothetical protein